MPTEREVLIKIMDGDSQGIGDLFERHGALFREGLIRFYGEAGMDQAEAMTKVIRSMAADLQADRFDDIVETFYDWVVRNAWSSLMALKLEEAGDGHLEAEVIFECSDRLNKAALSREVQQRCEEHFASCELCRGLLENCEGISVETRHAGAEIPEDFKPVIDKVLEEIQRS